MDNKAISVQDGIPGTFTMGGICAGASGRFLEMTSKRLGVDITETGPCNEGILPECPDEQLLHCIRHPEPRQCPCGREFPEDVAAAACPAALLNRYSNSNSRKVDIKEPVIMVEGPP